MCIDGNETAVADLVRDHAAKATTPSERCSSVFPAPISPLVQIQLVAASPSYVCIDGNETAVADLVREHDVAAKFPVPSQ